MLGQGGSADNAPDNRWSEPTLVQYDFRYGARQRSAVARLGFPRLDETHRAEWVCPFQLYGLKDNRVRLARANDGLLALMIANTFIRKSLDRLKSVSSDVVPHEVVFPRYLPFCYGLEFHHNLCKIVDAEIKKNRQLSRRRLARKRSS